MPLVLVTVLLGAVLGYTVRRPWAYTITAAVGAIAIVQIVWAVTDGKGNDPKWLIPAAVVGCAVALGLATATANLRRRA